MKMRIIAVAILGLLGAGMAKAGVVRFAAKRVVKPVVKGSYHAGRAVVKTAYKVAI